MEQALQGLLKRQGNVSENTLRESVVQLEKCHLRLKRELEGFILSEADACRISEGKTVPSNVHAL
jgi:hypothetical protein